MEKAYDHVNWKFLLYLLGCCGFGERWRRWMRHCVSSAHLSILVNGESVGFFNSSRPLLFVIVMEALSRMVLTSVEGRFLSRFSVENRHGLTIISHLLFADDILLFCEDNLGYIQSLKVILLCFEAVFALKINLVKTGMVAVGDVRDIRGLANILGCRVSSLPMKYLRLPLGATFKTKTIWAEHAIDQLKETPTGLKEVLK
ncbi:hypothetical protein F2P56_011425 [Juglans regia]|uniref:Reverse transcriptase domain-containing protein n=1 Tax=Juglans regia TaxID=51240 RepID=A0A833XV13_JUGRE|nr:hypothetical protein F2P56_011425 [Juglans regia]